MLAKITLYDGTVYKIASATTDTQDGIYLGRIKDELQLVSQIQEAGNAPATINLTIINHDDFIPYSKDLWAADVLLTNENGVSWRGKINFCNFDSDGNLYVTASEKTAPELELQLPDEVRQVYTVDEDFHQSSVTMTIPLVIGGTHEKPILVPTILIDKTQGIYLICVGEIREVVNVYSGSEKLPQWEYNSWRGTAEQPYHKGFAYVTIGYNKRFNADGSYAEINVEVVGLKLGDFTEEECRNGALFLYYFLTTAATGINGWGCGIDSNLIDTASFNSAITLCDQLGYKLDGIMWLRQSAQSWIDQICQAIHGKYSINANGKRSLFIDYAGNASKKTFTASNMQVDKYGKNSYTSVVYNKGILSYDYNPITGLFMQSAQYENSDSIAQIGEQKFIGESYLIKDATTALAVLEYTCKRSQTSAEAIEFKTDDVETNLRAGDIITINRPDLNLNNALYQIQSISTTDFISSIIAVKFDTSVFSVTGTASTVNWGNERDITPALTPAQATNLLLSTGFDINPDGTGIPYISGTFTVPDGGWLAAAVQYGIGASPSNWTELALITEGRFKLSPVNVGTVYSIRIRMITATGHSSYLTGQITATGDTIPPSEPTIAAKATDKTVTVQCGLDNPPYDMGGFQIYRKKSTDSESAYTYIGSIAANRGYASFTDYVDEYVTYNYQAKSYDRSGNLSTNFSNTASVTVTGIQANDVAATALAMPTGSILRLSAKNCTTASIAETNGVKDCSGRGNHGRAYNGVAVAYDDEEDTYFGFNGSANQYILVNPANLLAFVNGHTEFTIIARGKRTGDKTYLCGFANAAGYSLGAFDLYANTVSFGDRIDSNATIKTLTANVAGGTSNWHLYAVSVNYNTGIVIIYLDGVEVARSENWFTGTKANVDKFVVGNNPYNYSTQAFVGGITDVRVYPRALSATEIKSVFMIPEETVFAQLTTDMFGANIIHANYILNDGDFQTLAVNAVNANINNLNVVGNATFQSSMNGKMSVNDFCQTENNVTVINGGKIKTGSVTTDKLAANSITAEKLSVTTRRPNNCFVLLSARGNQESGDGAVVPDLSGFSNDFKMQNAVTISSSSTASGEDWTFGFTTTNGQRILSKSSVSIPVNFTAWIRVWITTTIGSGGSALFDMGISTGGNNRFMIYLNTSGYLCVYSRSNIGTLTEIATDIKPSTGWNDIFVNVSSTSIGVTVCQRGYANVVKKTITVSARAAFSATVVSVGGNVANTSNFGYYGYVQTFQLYGKNLTEDEIIWLSKNWINTESGQITADRIATDAIKSRNFSGSTDGSAFSAQGSFLDLANGNFITPFYRLKSSSSNKECQIGAWTIKANGAFEADSWATGTSVSEKPVITVKGTFAGGLSYTELNHFCYSAYAFYDPSGRYQDKTYVYLTPRGLTFERGDPPSGTVKFGIGEVDVVNPTTGSSTRWGLYVTGNAYCTNGTWTSCDENVKRDIKDVSTLAKLKEIRVKKFKYSQKAIQEKEWLGKQALIEKENAKKGIKTEEEKMPEFKDDENSPDYIMAMAGEFNKAFGVDNGNEEEINYTNAIGVALRSIQELAEIVDSQKAEIAELKALLKNQQDEKSEIIEHFNDLVKDSDSEDELVEPSFDELLKSEENQEEGQK